VLKKVQAHDYRAGRIARATLFSRIRRRPTKFGDQFIGQSPRQTEGFSPTFEMPQLVRRPIDRRALPCAGRPAINAARRFTENESSGQPRRRSGGR
jgi:hypothetical protein